MPTAEAVNASHDLLQSLFRTAIAAAHPRHCLAAHLPAAPHNGRLIVLAAGKAAGSMTEAAERHYLDDVGLDTERLAGLAVTRHGYGRPTRQIEVIEAGHPVPDGASLAAAERALQLADAATAEDLVLVLLSGGASANWIAPVQGVSFADKQAATRALLRSGATINELNAVRKHLSRIKGGRLALRAEPARVITLAISDVPGDDPSVIGSGVTVGDPTTLADAQAVLSRYALSVADTVPRALAEQENESPKPGHPVFASAQYTLIARPADAFRAAETAVRAAGYEPVMLGDRLQGEARDVAGEHARLALELKAAGRRAVILSGGELTVTIRGQGRGGPNQEYALALAMALKGESGISALAGDTDGTDGGGGSATDPAGAAIGPETLSHAARLGLDPARFLTDNDSTGFFERAGGLLQTGPTCTNVNDFRAILVDST